MNQHQLSPSEQTVFCKTISSFDFYARNSYSQTQKRRRDFHTLPLAHKSLLPDHLTLLEAVDYRIHQNQAFLNEIIASTCFSLSSPSADQQDIDKVKSTLKQFVRDWSTEGQEERNNTYTPIIDQIKKCFPDSKNVKVLVPGAGLARLCVEICGLGYHVQGNEFSWHMLFSSQFILNTPMERHSRVIYPYIHSFSNHPSNDSLLRGISIPDIVSRNFLDVNGGDLSMNAGEFVECYSRPSERYAWDCVVTCFFIDTAPNIISYLDTIRYCLKPETGRWINLGPLLWHWEARPDESSLEMGLNEVVQLAQRMGFHFLQRQSIYTGYTENKQSLLKYQYTAEFWTAKTSEDEYSQT